MDDPHFNALFNGDFEGDYDNVMDRVIEHINYGADEGNSSAYVDDGTAVDDDYDDDDSSDDDDDDANFIRRQFDDEKLSICTARALNLYYITYIHKEPCMVSYNTGMRWLNEILRGHWKRSVNMFRMDKDTLLSLCNDLETRYGLKPSRRMCVIEKVGMFLFTLAVGASNRHVQERFQHSGETVSRCMKEVLRALCLFAIDIIKPTDPDFTNTPIEIAMDPRFMPHFKVIFDVYIKYSLTVLVQLMGHMFVPRFHPKIKFLLLVGKVSQHKTSWRPVVLTCNSHFCILFVFSGKYYLVDVGYPNEYGYLGPYRGERYHLQDFRRRGELSGRHEVFNCAHSSLRNVIERTFGVGKQRWKILQCMPAYPYKTQVAIVVASMALHNYIRRRSQDDVVFVEYDRNPDYIPDDFLPDIIACENSQSLRMHSRMDIVRDGIANSLMGE
ncbi:protein ALP [Salix suchowensis]|nr:protein ALP [Salix suchowensis]